MTLLVPEAWTRADTVCDNQLMTLLSTGAIRPSDGSFQFYIPICDKLGVSPEAMQSFDKANIPEEFQQMQSGGHFGDETMKMVTHLAGYDVKMIVEVGSFIGGSSKKLAEMTKHLLICVDTWLGDAIMPYLPQFRNLFTYSKSGSGRMFDVFKWKMAEAKVSHKIIPLRLSSIPAARRMKFLGIRPDVVYLDSAHEAGETFLEANLYYDLLRPGGVIFGDDFDEFPAVTEDITAFVRYRGLHLFRGEGTTWIVKKEA